MIQVQSKTKWQRCEIEAVKRLLWSAPLLGGELKWISPVVLVYEEKKMSAFPDVGALPTNMLPTEQMVPVLWKELDIVLNRSPSLTVCGLPKSVLADCLQVRRSFLTGARLPDMATEVEGCEKTPPKGGR